MVGESLVALSSHIPVVLGCWDGLPKAHGALSRSRNTDCRRRLISLRWPSSLVDSSLTCFTATLVPSNLHSSTLNVSPCPIFCICSISSYKHLLIFSFCTVRSTPSRLCMALASEPSLNARPSTVERRVREILVTQLKVLVVESPTSVI